MATTPTKNSLKGKRDVCLSKPAKPKQGQKTLAWPMKLWEVLWCLGESKHACESKELLGGKKGSHAACQSGVHPDARRKRSPVSPRVGSCGPWDAASSYQAGETQIPGWLCHGCPGPVPVWDSPFKVPSMMDPFLLEYPQGSFRSIKSTQYPPPNTHR